MLFDRFWYEKREENQRRIRITNQMKQADGEETNENLKSVRNKIYKQSNGLTQPSYERNSRRKTDSLRNFVGGRARDSHKSSSVEKSQNSFCKNSSNSDEYNQ